MTAPRPWRPDRMPLAPAAGAIVFAWLALTPSLLPKLGVMQGVLCGVFAMIGYGLGALAGWIARSLGLRLTGRLRRTAWWRVFVAGGAGTVVALVRFWRNEQAMRTIIGIDRLSLREVAVAIVVGVVVFAVVLVLVRAVRGLGRGLGRLVGRVLPVKVAAVLGAVVAAAVVWVGIDNLVVERTVARLDAAFMELNDEFSTDVPAPTAGELSAGPRSQVTWDGLGRQGRVFITNTPTREAIAAFSGRDAKQPVRAYVGVGTEGDIDLREEARIAVDELERLGGFDRAVVNVATGTGRGWINENSSRALEFMWNGDTATVSMQYSYLPSWMSFLADGDRSQEAGRLLFDAVYERWLELPAATRPLLVASGESLGSFGSEAAFSGAQDLATRTDGAVYVGPTANNSLWSRFTADRDPGTLEIAPVYDGGSTVRFSGLGKDWPGDGAWEGTRVAYLQHANDPIQWWNWSLAFSKPDWMSEPRDRTVSPHLRWMPLLTMVQVAADQSVANDMPDGQGHIYGQAPAYAWATVLPPPGWTRADTDRLAPVLAALRIEDVDSVE